MPSSADRIEKEITLDAPRSRVWRAITDVKQFNEWFGVSFTTPFAQGETVKGQINIPGYEHVLMTVWVEAIEPETRFAYRWHPNANDPSVDYSKDATTLVTFTLADADGGTRLTITETGFDALPENRRLSAFKSNTNGWNGQAMRIQKYIAANP